MQHIFTNISRRKGNQAIIFGQLIERNMRNIFFLKNHAQYATEILFPDPFLKNWNWAYLWINILKFHTACLYGMSSWGLSEHIETSCRPLAFTSYEAFLKNKRYGTSLPISFSAWFLKKNICYILLLGQISLSCCLYFVRYCAVCVM